MTSAQYATTKYNRTQRLAHNKLNSTFNLCSSPSNQQREENN